MSLADEIPLQTPGGSDRPDWPQIESAIRQLATNYTHGTDALARGERATGERFYAATFTPDAEISVAGSDASRRIGPAGWVEFVEGTFQSRDERRTQHLVGSVNIVLAEDALSAEMSSYMHAAHMRGNGDVFTVLLTYVDHVVRTAVGWRIAKRTLYPAASWFDVKG